MFNIHTNKKQEARKSTVQRFWNVRQQTSREFDFLLIFSRVLFYLDTVLPKYLHLVTISKDLLAIFTLLFCPECCTGDTNIHTFFLILYFQTNLLTSQ
jgi:hypothetical protein